MALLLRVLTKLRRQTKGISSVEYALLLALIGAGIIAAANSLGTAVSDEMSAAADCIDGTDPDCNF